MSGGGVFSLNVHASYVCRHSGACCRAGWSIPVEPRIRSVLATEWLVPDADGVCPQFDRGSGLCRVHRDQGEAMLPESCHQFPRRALLDARGTFVTLSHFCPTAAALLVDAVEPLRIVAAPPAFPANRRYEGLDASGEWPPLLRPDALFDRESFAMWERFLVETLGGSEADVASTLARVAGAAERLRTWTVDRGPLVDWAAHTLAAGPAPDDLDSARRYERFTGIAAFRRAVQAVPVGLDAPAAPPQLENAGAAVATGWTIHARVILRFLGAKAFASWTAYQSRGVRTQVAELFMTAAILEVECARAILASGTPLSRHTLIEAIRAADRLLVHLAEREPLLEWLGKAEANAPVYAAR